MTRWRTAVRTTAGSPVQTSDKVGSLEQPVLLIRTTAVTDDCVVTGSNLMVDEQRSVRGHGRSFQVGDGHVRVARITVTSSQLLFTMKQPSPLPRCRTTRPWRELD